MLNDGQTLGNCGFTNQTARPQAPATVGLAFRTSGKFLARCPAVRSPPLVRGVHVSSLVLLSQMIRSSS